MKYLQKQKAGSLHTEEQFCPRNISPGSVEKCEK